MRLPSFSHEGGRTLAHAGSKGPPGGNSRETAIGSGNLPDGWVLFTPPTLEERLMKVRFSR